LSIGHIWISIDISAGIAIPRFSDDDITGIATNHQSLIDESTSRHDDGLCYLSIGRNGDIARIGFEYMLPLAMCGNFIEPIWLGAADFIVTPVVLGDFETECHFLVAGTLEEAGALSFDAVVFDLPVSRQNTTFFLSDRTVSALE
jgi:hypothetical protein